MAERLAMAAVLLGLLGALACGGTERRPQAITEGSWQLTAGVPVVPG